MTDVGLGEQRELAVVADACQHRVFGVSLLAAVAEGKSCELVRPRLARRAIAPGGLPRAALYG